MTPDCAGVTYSRSEIGGKKSKDLIDGKWGFQLRKGTTFKASPNGKNSWLKI